HKGIEDEEPGSVAADGLGEPRLVTERVEAEARGEDDVEGDVLESEPPPHGETLETGAHRRGWILGGEDQDRPGPRDRVGPESRCARSNGEGEIEGEPTLATLRGATDDPDALLGPEPFHKPGGAVTLLDRRDLDDRQRVVLHESASPQRL